MVSVAHRCLRQPLLPLLPILVACALVYSIHFGTFFLPGTLALVEDLNGQRFMPSQFDSWRVAGLSASGSWSPARFSLALQNAYAGAVEPVTSRFINLTLHLLSTVVGALMLLRLMKMHPATSVPWRRAAAITVLAMGSWCLLPLHVSMLMDVAAREVLLANLMVLIGMSLYLWSSTRWRGMGSARVVHSQLAALLLVFTLVASSCHAVGLLLPAYAVAAALLWLWRGQPVSVLPLTQGGRGLPVLAMVWLASGAVLMALTGEKAAVVYLSSLPVCMLLGWVLSAPAFEARGLTIAAGVALLFFLGFLTFLKTADWQSAARLSEREYMLHPDSVRPAQRLAAAYYGEAGRQAEDAAAQRFLLAARQLYAQTLTSKSDSVASLSGLLVIDSVLAQPTADLYPRLAVALRSGSATDVDIESLRRLMRCVEGSLCSPPPVGFGTLLHPPGTLQSPRVLELLLEYCLNIEDYDCLRREAQALLAQEPGSLLAYRALYLAARVRGDVAAAQAVVLQMAEADTARRWQSLLIDYAAGRL